jgi:hypothetical protein
MAFIFYVVMSAEHPYVKTLCKVSRRLRSFNPGTYWPLPPVQRGAGVAQSVLGLDGGQDGAETRDGFSSPKRPRSPPSILFCAYRDSFPGAKWQGRGINHSLPSGAVRGVAFPLPIYSLMPWPGKPSRYLSRPNSTTTTTTTTTSESKIFHYRDKIKVQKDTSNAVLRHNRWPIKACP